MFHVVACGLHCTLEETMTGRFVPGRSQAGEVTEREGEYARCVDVRYFGIFSARANTCGNFARS